MSEGVISVDAQQTKEESPIAYTSKDASNLAIGSSDKSVTDAKQ